MAKQKAEPKFQVGDIVRKTYGETPLRVESVVPWGGYGYRIKARYLHSQRVVDYENENAYVLIEEETKMTTTNTLYKITTAEGEVYGTHIGTDSSGRYIMEEKGTGAIRVVSAKDIEEVLPFTFSVRMGGREQHFQGEAGKFTIGDILLYSGGGADKFELAVVKKVDTKNKSASRAFEGVRVVTEKL